MSRRFVTLRVDCVTYEMCYVNQRVGAYPGQ
jgi:hypothetical protein